MQKLCFCTFAAEHTLRIPLTPSVSSTNAWPLFCEPISIIPSCLLHQVSRTASWSLALIQNTTEASQGGGAAPGCLGLNCASFLHHTVFRQRTLWPCFLICKVQLPCRVTRMIIVNSMSKCLSRVLYKQQTLNKRQLGDQCHDHQVAIYSIGCRWFRAQPSNPVNKLTRSFQMI